MIGEKDLLNSALIAYRKYDWASSSILIFFYDGDSK